MTEHTDSSLITLSRFRADISRALGRQGKKLLDSATLPAQVAALAPLEAFYMIKELGVENAVPILLHTTEEQLQTCIDLDCWHADTFSPTELDAWLAPFASEGPEVLAEVFFRLDGELQVMFLAASVDIADVRHDEIVDTDDEPRYATADGFFILQSKDPDREVDPFALVEALYRADMHEGFRLLTAAKWEIAITLEEQAFVFRAGRLEDLGFPPPEAAARLFARPAQTPPALVGGPPMPAALPALYAGVLLEGSLLTRGLGRIVDTATLQRLEAELVYLINAAVVAYGESPRDISHVGDIAARVRDILSLGLDVMLSPAGPLAFDAGEDAAARAAQVLTDAPLMHIFQHGSLATTPLQRQAQSMGRDAVIAAWLNKDVNAVDDPEAADRAFLQALSKARPLWAGVDPFHPQRTRAFASQNEIAQGQARLDALAQRLT